jgi:hypothetical protein
MDEEATGKLVPVRATPNAPARARVRWAWSRASLEVDAEITPAGFLAIGGMVGMILLAVVPIVLAGGRARRRLF